MRLSEFAKELNVSDQAVLKKLKSLKLKAIDGDQELNKAVLIVLRSELRKDMCDPIKYRAMERGREPVVRPRAVPEEIAAAEEKPSTRAKKKEAEPTTAKKKKTVKKTDGAEPEQKKATTRGKAAPKKAAATAGPEPVVEAPSAPAPEEKKAAPEVKPSAPVISDAPFVPLKPLAKKKRKPSGRGGEGDGRDRRSEGPSGQAAVVMPSAGTTPPSDAELIDLELKIPISVKDFAVRIQQKTSVVLKKLMQMGVFCTLNQNLDEGAAKQLAREFGYNITRMKTQEQQLIEVHQQEDDNPEQLIPRAPVVTLMGHVDHGKTSLLDRIRKSQIADSEHGGITQHIGAYSVRLPKGTITFLDTPGHEAFTAMRARGAHITDLIILVVAADEGIRPQTLEAIDHARAAGVPLVVALNKIDRRNADVDRVKKELSEHGLTAEDWGGNTTVVGVSAATGEGVDQLLEMLLLEAEMLELRANKEKRASGIVVEAHMSRGKGSIASLIVQSGTLRLNDVLVVGPYYCRVKAMFDDHEVSIQEAGPSTPVEILGLPGVPAAGELFYVIEDERQAKEICALRQEQLKNEKLGAMKKITLEDIYSQIQDGVVQELNVIIKADVQGSLEALHDSLAKIPSDEVKVKFIHTGVGDVNFSDVILAVASNAIIMAFHVGIGPKAKEELEKQPVDVRTYRIIYDAVNDVRNALEGMLAPRLRRKDLARVEVRQVFKLSKSGIIAGCFVVKGKVTRKVKVDVVRDGEVIHSGTLGSLKRFKDDVKEVGEGYECGIAIDGFDKIQPGDLLVTYEVESIARTLKE